MPMWWWARLGMSWSSISIAAKPAASAIGIVRCMCIGSPKPVAPSRISGSEQTVRMSMPACTSSVMFRFASSTTFV